jgi:diamine N-acetyltransferase
MTDLQPIGPDSIVSLRPVTKDNLRDIFRLKVTEAQEQFVANNAVSLAQAHFAPEAWYRAIYADETPVGFMMLYDDPAKPEYFLWRLLVDAHYQRHGYGRQAIALLVDYVKTRPGVKELLVSHCQGEGNPGPFYSALGFVYTGTELENELVMSLPLEPSAESTPHEEANSDMFTHVVLFKLKNRSPEAIEETAGIMRSMEGQIPPLRGIEVGVDVVKSPRSYDLALITRFDSLADMRAYQAHPYHQNVVLKHVNEVTESVVAVDFEED